MDFPPSFTPRSFLLGGHLWGTIHFLCGYVPKKTDSGYFVFKGDHLKKKTGLCFVLCILGVSHLKSRMLLPVNIKLLMQMLPSPYGLWRICTACLPLLSNLTEIGGK